jgi:N utilization substance protein B
MQPQYSPKNNPRVIIIQKLYGKFFNKEEELSFPKHRFKKFIKDVVKGTIERNEVIDNEIQIHLENDIKLKKLDKIFIIIIKSAIFELLYKPNVSSKIIIKEYLNASNYFIDLSQTKYLNALLDKISNRIRA